MFRYPPQRRRSKDFQGFTLVEVLIGILVGAFLLVGMVQFSKGVFFQSRTSQSSTTQDQELSRFQALMITDLERAGNDASGLGVLKSYQALPGSDCVQKTFGYGLVEFPSDNQCKDAWGVLGILSYQGIDVDHDGVFFPEEGVNFAAPVLRPSAGTTGAANHYNDFIVYHWDLSAKTIVRKNLGDPNTTAGDTSEVVLRNVALFSVEFRKILDPNDVVKPGALSEKNAGVTVRVMVFDPRPDPNYANPNFQEGSEFYHVRTVERQFTFDVIDTALCVY